MSIKETAKKFRVNSEVASTVQVLNSALFFLLKTFYIPILFALLLGYMFYKKESQAPQFYKASIKFVENSKFNTGSNTGNRNNLQQIGNFGGAGTSSELVSEVVRSDAIINKTLFSPVSSRDNEMIINRYMRVMDSSRYKDLFFYSPNIDSLTEAQKSYYNRVKNQIINPNSEIFTFTSNVSYLMNVNTPDEILTFSLVNTMYNSLEEFYQQNNNDTFDKTYHNLIHSRDSVYRRLMSLESNLASNESRSGFNRNPIQQLPDIKLQQEIELTRKFYYSLFNQIQTYKLQNDQTSDIFRKLNYPNMPLPKTKPKLILQTIIGSLLGFFIGCFVSFFIFVALLVRRLYLHALRFEHPESTQIVEEQHNNPYLNDF